LLNFVAAVQCLNGDGSGQSLWNQRPRSTRRATPSVVLCPPAAAWRVTGWTKPVPVDSTAGVVRARAHTRHRGEARPGVRWSRDARGRGRPV